MKRPCLRKAKPLLCLLLSLSAPLAQAATATASLSKVRVEVVDLRPADGNWPWVWVVNNVGWVAPSSSTQAQILDPALGEERIGWLGEALSSQAGFGSALATASIISVGDLGGAGSSASASAAADGGLSAWAIAQLFSGRLMAGAGTRIVVTAQVDGISANAAGGLAQATASLGIANDSGGAFDSSQAWAFDSADFSQTATPTLLSVQWDNPGADAAWGQLWITVSAQAIAAAPVPEPTSALLFGLGLAAVAVRRRR